MSKVTTRPSNFADRSSAESAFAVRDVRGRCRNNYGLRERKREREAYLSRVLKEKGEKDRLFHGVNDGVRMSVTGGRIAYQERRNGS